MKPTGRRPRWLWTLVLGSWLLPVAEVRAQDLKEEEAKGWAAYHKGEALRAEGRATEAIVEYKVAVAAAVRVLGPDAALTADAMEVLGILYTQTAQYDKAEPLFARVLASREARLGPDHIAIAQSLDNHALALDRAGRAAQAEPLYRRALAIREAKLGPDDPDVAQCVEGLAIVAEHRGRLDEAEPLYRRALAIREAKLGPDDPLVAQSLVNLAGWSHRMGRLAESDRDYRRALKIMEAKLGPDHLDVAATLSNLASLDRSMGREPEAEPLLRRSLMIHEAKLGPDHPDVANALTNLAALYWARRRYAEALPLLERVLTIREARLGPDHPDVAQALGNLAMQYEGLRQYEKALPLVQRSLLIREARLGPRHPDVAISLNGLASLSRELGRTDEVEPLLRRALAIRETTLGPDHPDVAQILNNLSNIEAEQGRWPEAIRDRDRARRIIRRHVGRVLPTLSEVEQLSFLKSQDTSMLHRALAMPLARPDDPGLVTTSAGWVLNGKAVAQEALAQRSLLGRDRADAHAAPLVRRLSTLRGELAATLLAPPEPGQEAERRRRLDRLAGEEEALSRQLVDDAGIAPLDDRWVEPEEVRKALAADTVLVEIVRFPVSDFLPRGTTSRTPTHYAAWVIPPTDRGAIRLVDLGDAGPIEAGVAAVRRALRPDLAALRARGEPAAEAEVRAPLEALSARVLGPLLPHIGASGRWVISPDAALWLIPWAALPLPDGRYAVEGHTIHHVVSGRDLVRASARPSAGAAFLMADPDYDLAPAEAGRAALQILRKPVGDAPDALALRALPLGDLAAGAAPRLPGTAAEAQSVLPKVRIYAHSEPILYNDRWALEAVVKAFKRPRVVVLSTHGFFRDAIDPAADGGSAIENGRPRTVPIGENPLLRCGLLLAGCNRRDRTTRPGGEDGILTGLEIVEIDLRGTDLVVLSACETGLGQIHNGEGVAGLRQAFQLAGARSVVATLWQVPDRESARLMIAFFDNLAAGKGKAEALREAQLAQIKSRRERFGAAHPFFWAAYTLTGESP